MINSTCIFCEHFELGKKCSAYDVIPDLIWNGDHDHSEPLPDQENDIVFEPIKE